MKKTPSDKLTPMMKQYKEIKSRNPGHILFYRLGDFYEMFFEDAKTASEVLDLTLTTRGKHLGTEIPLAGFPHHQLNGYLSKMIRSGYKVAVCDQTEDPGKAKGIVKRDVVEIVTPGTALNEDLIESSANNYIMAVCGKEGSFGFSAADISTGEFLGREVLSENELNEIISLFSPSEILLSDSIDPQALRSPKTTITPFEDYRFLPEVSSVNLKKIYGIKSSSSLGFKENDISLCSAGVLLEYLKDNIKSGFSHLERYRRYDDKNFCTIDHRTRRNLEITEPIHTGGDISATLYAVMNRTNTAMGARLLRKWLISPLRDSGMINRRLEITHDFVSSKTECEELIDILSKTTDIERLAGRISTSKIRPDELVRLKNSLKLIPEIKECIFHTGGSRYLNDLGSSFETMEECIGLIDKAISDDSSLDIRQKRFIRPGYSKELDELSDIAENGRDKLLGLSEKVKEEIGIPAMKIGFNKVFGYYFEVTKKYSDMIPGNFIRKQTLVNSERFINQDLKELEEKILGADEKIDELTYGLYEDLKEKAKKYIGTIKKNSEITAELDCLLSFARTATEKNYTRPVFNNNKEITIKNGRHPVVEAIQENEGGFIPNDLYIKQDGNILIITGPNMSGKSTYLRQSALIVLLAQAGSFVPASEADIGMADKIFTRVGASDDLAGGESTFLVEMNETANILNNATPDSLIIFDEVGRGTATFDGLSLAWSIVEYIHNEPGLSSRTLFATHYHELTEIERICPRVRNYSVSVTEHKDEIIFMRKIVEGGADHSYGIFVAKLAGIPDKVLKRAQTILRNLEENELTPDSKPVIARKETDHEPGLFSIDNDIVREELSKSDPDNMTPVQALLKLKEIKELL